MVKDAFGEHERKKRNQQQRTRLPQSLATRSCMPNSGNPQYEHHGGQHVHPDRSRQSRSVIRATPHCVHFPLSCIPFLSARSSQCGHADWSEFLVDSILYGVPQIGHFTVAESPICVIATPFLD